MKTIFDQINTLAEKYRDYTAGNLSRLVKIKSISLHEKEVQHELMRQMQEAGFDEVRLDGFGNVIGRIGNGKRTIAFDGHMDTVDMGNLRQLGFRPFGW
jgi:acetylornithine deacetylase/succinyl-diaminopimelate desuccinylase-like protein